jgi:hypothetical protein
MSDQWCLSLCGKIKPCRACPNKRPQGQARQSNTVMPFHDSINPETTTPEWYTPMYIFEAFGPDHRFDLDPASAGEVAPWVPATEHYTEGGLERPWRGYVWLNCPYGRGVIDLWAHKFVQHGNGIMLVPTRDSTVWWQELIRHADLYLHVSRKIPFIGAHRTGTATAFAIGSTLVAIGPQGVSALHTAARNGLGILAQTVMDAAE